MTNYIRRRQQRGVILLAIISLLTMFMLIGITYVVVSGHFKRAAVTNSRVRQLEVPPQKHLDGAMYQLLRDTNFAGSVVRGHSLLQDKYGHYSVQARIETNRDINLNEIRITNFSMRRQFSNTNQILVMTIKITSGFVENPDGLTGRVITFLDDSINISGHVLNATFIANKLELQILLRGRSSFSELVSRAINNNLDIEILINGRDFSGTGFGLEYAKIVPDNISPSPLDPLPTTIQPNPLFNWQITTEALWPNRAADTKEEFDAFRFGGANEGYDVPDYQNMAMAALISNSNTRELQYIIPSFHRPTLINYWEKRLYRIRDSNPDLNDEEELAITKARTAAIMNKIVMRPRKEEHPFFTGSNPSFHPINGPWDVDNDGDGIRDSIWIDMGFSIQTDTSGRQYKPLFAVLCLDMDGRLNLNAHGNEIHHLTNNVRGMGYGPAEIKLTGLFGSRPNDYLKLLKGDAGTPGRYGSDGSPGKSGFDPLSNFIFGRFSDNFVNYEPNTSFQFMPDIHGELEYRINNSGNVFYEAPINRTTGKLRIMDQEDNPYEVNLVSPNSADQLFNANEMEALLRYHDPDNPQFLDRSNSVYPQRGGSSRLYRLTDAFNFNGNSNYASANRRSVTTASFDPPVPSIQFPKKLRPYHIYNKKSASFRQLLKALLRSQGVQENHLDQIIQSLNLNPKFFSGLKMDVNQPFGDGLDNNKKDGVVDNPNESNLPTMRDKYLDRHDYARNLYIMMLLMKDKDRKIDFNGDETATTDETHRNIAQWAVNAVDFRDTDSIMTPFEFDLNPFDGWDVDGIIHSLQTPSLDDGHADRALVWGTERPELLITESLAFHDRRTEDLDIDGDAGVDTFQGMAMDDDKDFDQRLLPRSGVFFELYNPWQSVYDKDNLVVVGSNRPAEFHQDDNMNLEEGIRLDQLSSAQNADRSPVWRMIIVRGEDKIRDPDAWNIANDPLTIERAIYFVDGQDQNITIPAADNPDITERFFFSPQNLEHPKPLKPLQYAVIGSSGYNKNGKKYTTYLGRHVKPMEGEIEDFNDQTNRIELNPTDSVVGRGHMLRLNEKPAVCIPINWHYKLDNTIEEKSLTITEPVFGYDLGNTDVTADGERFLENILVEPLDKTNRIDVRTNNSRVALNRKGTTNDFAVVHLQRLAIPLKAHNKSTNPYRTIDTASIDVTAFNGVYKRTAPGATATKCGSLFPLENGWADNTLRFDSHERGKRDALALNKKNNLWNHEVPTTNTDHQNIEIDDHIFKYDFKATLGFWNDSYVKFAADGQPFPWLQWNNRPFVSQLELMMVPRSSSSQLLKDYSFNNSTGNWNPYIPNGDKTNAAYGHLLNFFESDSDPNGPNPNRASSNFHRLFDYTEVQSYFTGAQTYYFDRPPQLPTEGIRRDGLNPPFKRITNYRDPGRINLNTIFDPVVFNGLMNGHEKNPTGPNYAEWFDSRQAWEISNNYYPTYFANPIRPAGSGDMVPPIEPLPGDYFKSDGSEMNDSEKLAEFKQARHRALLKQPDVEVSLLRNKRNALEKHLPLFSTGYDENYRNSSRNPTFEYQSLQRLGNLTTGRSNVYSVWITVGYFEVTPKTIRNTFDPTGDKDVNLTGYQLGAEVGIDEGRIKRHRAFYMIDRSIPVAFEPGENHNVDNAVILRRYID